MNDLIPYLKERLKLHGDADTWVSTRLQRKEVKEIIRLLEEGERLRKAYDDRARIERKLDRLSNSDAHK